MIMKSISRWYLVIVVFVATPAVAQPRESLVGRLTDEQVRGIVAKWGTGSFSVDDRWIDRVQSIKRVRSGATVRVFMGTWCHSSKQEIPQFLNLVDALEEDVPFAVEFFAVDENKKLPAGEIRTNDVQYLPTFIVLRNGQEIGRVVEQPARTLETDLLRLLNGTARGLLSSNESAIVRYLTK
jgi:thiol-disulfide isomerase/thioredoxin